MNPWQEHLSEVPDPRRQSQLLRHPLVDVLSIALCAMLSGAEGFEEFAQFGQTKEEWLRTRLGLELPHGIPSHDTFARVFARLDPVVLEQVLEAWTQNLHEKTQGEVLALDGKCLRGSLDTVNQRGALILVSIWASRTRLVLSQAAVPEGGSELSAVPLLLELVDVQGATLTADAFYCRKEVAQQVQAKGADYVLALKGNQALFHEQVRDLFAWCEQQPGGLEQCCDDWCEHKEWGHGRAEVRRAFVLRVTEQDWPQEVQAWPGLGSLLLVERRCQPMNTPAGSAAVSLERRYFISSLAPQAALLLTAVRSHWGIENSEHWVLDVAFHEDQCRVRRDHAGQNLGILRRLSLNLLRRYKDKVGIKARRLKAAWDTDYLLQVLSGPQRTL